MIDFKKVCALMSAIKYFTTRRIYKRALAERRELGKGGEARARDGNSIVRVPKV